METGLFRTELFVSGQKGHHTYRIPSLAITPTGTVLAFCEGRKLARSDTGDIALLLKRSTDGGRTWSEQQVVWDDRDDRGRKVTTGIYIYQIQTDNYMRGVHRT